MEGLQEKIKEQIEDIVNDYKARNGISLEVIEDELSITMFMVGDKFNFILLVFRNIPIASIMDMGDHMIESYYYDTENGESKNNVH